jgi:hypothetical protein
MWWLAPPVAAVVVSAALLWPGSAGADDSDGPHLMCAEQSLPIMAAEVSGLRLRCTVLSAPAGDQAFMVSLEQMPAQVAETGAPALEVRTICSGGLQAGSGACSGMLFDAAGPAFGGGRLTATLLPSGMRLEQAAAPPDEAGSPGGAPEFEPLPDAP